MRSSINVTNQCDDKLAYKTDECEQATNAIIRIKERNTNILKTVTDFLDWLSGDQLLNMISPLWYYIIIVVYSLVK
jgi:L-cysteine desulfidase